MSMESPGAEKERKMPEIEDALKELLVKIAAEDKLKVNSVDVAMVAHALIESFEKDGDPLTLQELKEMNAETRRTFHKALFQRSDVNRDLAGVGGAPVSENDLVIGQAESREEALRQIRKERGA